MKLNKPLIRSTSHLKDISYEYFEGGVHVWYGSTSIVHIPVEPHEVEPLFDMLERLKTVLKECRSFEDRKHIENPARVKDMLNSAGHLVYTSEQNDFVVVREFEDRYQYFRDAAGLVAFSRQVGVLK